MHFFVQILFAYFSPNQFSTSPTPQTILKISLVMILTVLISYCVIKLTNKISCGVVVKLNWFGNKKLFTKKQEVCSVYYTIQYSILENRWWVQFMMTQLMFLIDYCNKAIIVFNTMFGNHKWLSSLNKRDSLPSKLQLKA